MLIILNGEDRIKYKDWINYLTATRPDLKPFEIRFMAYKKVFQNHKPSE